MATAKEARHGATALKPMGDPAQVAASGLLVVLRAASPDGGSVPPGTPLAGLPLLARIVIAGARAGFAPILVHPAFADARGLLAGAGASPLVPDARSASSGRARIVLLAANVLPRVEWLRSLLAMPIEPGRAYSDGASVAVLEAGDPSVILAHALRADDVRACVASLRDALAVVDGRLGGDGRFTLASPRAVPEAEAWLLRGLVKEAEGFMSRHVERRISLALTRRLASTRVTPNAMTLVSVGVGLLGAPFFLSSAPASQLTGALLLLSHSILDGCDGELARLKFQESRVGSLLDFWGDNMVHVAIMASIAVGWSRAVDALWPLALGAVAVTSVLLTAGFVYRRTRQPTAVAGPLFPPGGRHGASRWARMADLLARRDFIYLVVLLAAAGKSSWFLVLAAVGTPIFLLALVWLARAEARPRGGGRT